MVKAPPGPDSLAPWTPPEWDEWDQVLVADGPGTRPAIFTFRTSPIAEGDIRTAYEQLVDVAANLSVRGANVPVRTIAVFCVSGIQPEAARKLCRLSPRRYFPNVQPELWVVDLTAGRLYTPRAFGFFTSRAGKAVRGALQRLEQGHGIELNDIAEAQRTARVDREAFARAVSKNVPYLTYAIIAICALVFLYEGHLAPKCWLDASSPACQKASIWL